MTSPSTAPPPTGRTSGSYPIIAGFHPDPSICRVDGDYYLATSSFEYFPAVPIFHSRNLLTWELIGNALDRPSQFAPGTASANGGIYAPTLRHANGRFWLVTTNVSVDKGHMIVTATAPQGPWSDPVFVAGAAGIDPDLTWDTDGRCYLTWRTNAGIVQAAIDPEIGTLHESPRLIWTGTGLAWPEGPHLYRRAGWWYLVIAEGGTERGHCVSVARSPSITGPFQGAPHNPVFSHRSTDHPVQNVGHADLVEGPDGEWIAVHLGTRPNGTTPHFHVNGRETFLAGVWWADGWPSFDETRFDIPARDHSFTDDFRSARLHPRWVSPNAMPEEFTDRDQAGALRLLPDETAADSGILAVRTRDPAWVFSALASVGGGAGRLLLRMDDRHWCALDLTPDQATARLRIGPAETALGSVPLASSGPHTLRISAMPPSSEGPDDIELGVDSGPGYRRLARFDGRYLSTEVAGGFRGRVIGLQAAAGAVTVHEVRYETVR